MCAKVCNSLVMQDSIEMSSSSILPKLLHRDASVVSYCILQGIFICWRTPWGKGTFALLS